MRTSIVLAAAAAGLLVFASYKMGQSATAADKAPAVAELRVQRIVLVDDAGRDRAILGKMKLGKHDGVYGLVILDEDGKARVAVASNDNGDAGVVQIDADQAVRVFQGTLKLGDEAGTAFFDPQGNLRAFSLTDREGEHRTEIRDHNGELVRESVTR